MYLHPVILNPEAPLNGDLFYLNDPYVNMMEHHLLQLENEVYLANPVEEELMEIADEIQQEQLQEQLQIPRAIPQSPIDYLGDEIPLDQLVGEEGFPEEPVELNVEEPPVAAQMALQPQADEAVPHADGPALPEEDELLQPQVGDNFSNNLHVGMALISSDHADPVWARAKQAEATRLWARLFSSGNATHVHTSIPTSWANFFTVLLLSPTNFQWAKNLLSTKIPELLMTGNGSIEFSIPAKCPEHNLKCLTESDDEGSSKGKELKDIEAAQSSTRKRSSKNSPVLVETQVRRSPSLKHNNKGFRTSSCTDKRCLACGPEPPIICKEAVKKLAFDFCKLDQTELNDDILQTKRKKSRPIATARTVPVIQDGPEEGEDEQELKDKADHLLQLLEKHQASDGEA